MVPNLKIALPPDLAESILKITRERRVDAALLTMIKEYLELKINDIEKRINDYKEKYVKSISVKIEGPILKCRIYLNNSFISVFFNEETKITAFTLIKENRR